MRRVLVRRLPCGSATVSSFFFIMAFFSSQVLGLVCVCVCASHEICRAQGQKKKGIRVCRRVCDGKGTRDATTQKSCGAEDTILRLPAQCARRSLCQW